MARPVAEIGALRDDALQPELASMAQHRRPVLLEMLAEAQGQVGRRAGDDLLQQRLAIEQRCAGQVPAVEIKEIEQHIEAAIVAAGRQLLLQPAEIGDAGLVGHDDLAVEQGGAEAEPLQCAGDGGKAFGPVDPGARQKPHLPTVDARLQAVAVELDLVDPFGAARRLVARLGEAELDPGGQQPLARAADAGGVGQGRAAGRRDLGPCGVVGAQRAARGNLLGGAAAHRRRRLLQRRRRHGRTRPRP